MPADMKRYGDGWKSFSDGIRFVRAEGRCECEGECGLHPPKRVRRRCTEKHGDQALFAKGKVILTVAHLCDCDPPCMKPEHVKAMCQRCHLRIDVALHVRHRNERRRKNMEEAGQLSLVK